VELQAVVWRDPNDDIAEYDVAAVSADRNFHDVMISDTQSLCVLWIHVNMPKRAHDTPREGYMSGWTLKPDSWRAVQISRQSQWRIQPQEHLVRS